MSYNFKDFLAYYDPDRDDTEGYIQYRVKKRRRGVIGEEMTDAQMKKREESEGKSVEQQIADLEKYLRTHRGNSSSMRMKKVAIERKIEALKKQLTNEEVEHIDELSAGLLARYSEKARRDALKHSRFNPANRNNTPEQDAENEKRQKKRMEGDKLAGEKIYDKLSQNEAYAVKYAKSKNDKISVAKYDSEKDAKKFLASVTKDGYRGIITKEAYETSDQKKELLQKVRSCLSKMSHSSGRRKNGKPTDPYEFNKAASKLVGNKLNLELLKGIGEETERRGEAISQNRKLAADQLDEGWIIDMIDGILLSKDEVVRIAKLKTDKQLVKDYHDFVVKSKRSGLSRSKQKVFADAMKSEMKRRGLLKR